MLVPDLYVFTLKFLAYKKDKNMKKKKYLSLRNCSVRTLQCFQFKKKKKIAQKVEKTPSKVAHNLPHFFSCTGPATQTSPDLIFHVPCKTHLCSYLWCATPSIPEIIWVKNVRAIVVCGFLMKSLKNRILKIWKKSWAPFRSYLLNSTANPAHFHSNWTELAVLFSR